MWNYVRMDTYRYFYRWYFLAPFLILIGFLIQGIETYFDPIFPSAVDAFLYAQGKGPSALMPVIFPIAVTLLTGGSLAWDRKSGYYDYAVIRTSYRRYVGSKFISAAIASSILVIVSELIALGYACLRYPKFRDSDVIVYYAPELYNNSPILYVLLIISNIVLASIAISFISIACSSIVKNVYVVVGMPWAIFIFLQFALYITGHIRYAPIDLIGIYMLRNYETFTISSIWISISFLLVCMTYGVYSLRYKMKG